MNPEIIAQLLPMIMNMMNNKQQGQQEQTSQSPASSELIGENQIPAQTPSELFKFQRPPAYLSKIQEAIKLQRGV